RIQRVSAVRRGRCPQSWREPVSAERPRIQHRIEHALLRTAERAFGGLTPETADRVGGALGSFVHRPLGIRRGVVAANLRLAFPDAAPEWVEEVTVATYRHLGREAVAMLRLSK